MAKDESPVANPWSKFPDVVVDPETGEAKTPHSAAALGLMGGVAILIGLLSAANELLFTHSGPWALAWFVGWSVVGLLAAAFASTLFERWAISRSRTVAEVKQRSALASSFVLAIIGLCWFGVERHFQADAAAHPRATVAVAPPSGPTAVGTAITKTQHAKTPRMIGQTQLVDDHVNAFWSEAAREDYAKKIASVRNSDQADALMARDMPGGTFRCTVTALVDAHFGKCRIATGKYTGRSIIVALPDDDTTDLLAGTSGENPTEAPTPDSSPILVGETGIASGVFAFSPETLRDIGSALAANDRDGAMSAVRGNGCLLAGDRVRVTAYRDRGTVVVARVVDGHWRGRTVYGPAEQVAHAPHS